MKMFKGLNAFPLTPIVDDQVDEAAFGAIVRKISGAGVNNITVLGSTGSAAYLSFEEKERVVNLAVESAGNATVFAGVSAIRTSDVLENIAAAEKAGVKGLLLAPVSYQPLTEEEVLMLFRMASDSTSLPIVLYDNPGTTKFSFSLDLYAKIAELEGVSSIKVPPIAGNLETVKSQVQKIREVLPEHVTIGISGDATAANALLAGCDAWYSVLAGTMPEPALKITEAALKHDLDVALAESLKLQQLWDLFAEFGSYRVVASLAEHLGLVKRPSLPLPILGLDDADHHRVKEALTAYNL